MVSAGTVISGRYRLERLLGEGGMGQVWVARHLNLDSLVAVKLLAPTAVSNEILRARFEREARALGQLRSPHVVHIYDYGVDEVGPFMVMELLEGDDLAYLRSQRKYWSVSEVAQIVMQAARGLTAAHKAGVIHRDIKPGNLFLARSEGEAVLKVLDFGIAKPLEETATEITKTNVGVGSPSYMSPEQTQAQRVDPRTDVWSLGVVAFVLLTGELPFQAESPFLVGQKVLRGQRPKPTQLVDGLPRSLDAFFERALATTRDERFSTPLEMADALAAIARLYPNASGTDPEFVTTERLSAVQEARKALANRGPTPFGLTIKLTADEVGPGLARAGYAPAMSGRAERASQPALATAAAPNAEEAFATSSVHVVPIIPAAPRSSAAAAAMAAAARQALPKIIEPTSGEDASDYAPTARLDSESVRHAVQARNARLAQSGVNLAIPNMPPPPMPPPAMARAPALSQSYSDASFQDVSSAMIERPRTPALSQSYSDASFQDVSSAMVANPFRSERIFLDTSAAFGNPMRRPTSRRGVIVLSIVGGTLVHVGLLLGAWYMSTTDETTDTASSSAPSAAKAATAVRSSSTAAPPSASSSPSSAAPSSSVSADKSSAPKPKP